MGAKAIRTLRHRSTLDAEVAADFAQPHRPVTMAFREVFQKLLNEETDWSAPDGKATAQAEADADDGQDPGKKLFWSTTHPDNPGVPFPGWGDPNAEPDHPLVSPAACSTCRPELFFYYIIEDPAPPKEDENFAVEAQAHMTMGDLPFGALKALDNMVVGEGGKVIGRARARRSSSTASAPCPASPRRSPVRGRSAAAPDRGRSRRIQPRHAAHHHYRGRRFGPCRRCWRRARNKHLAHGTDWLWFFELVQAFRDVHGVRPYPPPDESLKQEGPGSIECA